MRKAKGRRGGAVGGVGLRGSFVEGERGPVEGFGGRGCRREGSLGGGDDAVEELGGGKNTGNAGTRVGARPAKIEALDILGDIVGAEPGALSEDGFELKGGADVGVKTGLKIGRREENFADQMFAQVGDQGFLEGGEDPFGVLLLDLIPVDFVAGGTAVGNGRKDIKTFVSGRGEAGIGAGRGMKIKGKVLGQNAVVKNIVEEALVPWAEPDGVMGKLGIGTVGAEINQEKGHAVAHPAESGIGPFAAMGGRDTFLVEVGDVRVGDHDFGAENFSGAEADAGGSAIFHEELLDR